MAVQVVGSGRRFVMLCLHDAERSRAKRVGVKDAGRRRAAVPSQEKDSRRSERLQITTAPAHRRARPGCPEVRHP